MNFMCEKEIALWLLYSYEKRLKSRDLPCYLAHNNMQIASLSYASLVLFIQIANFSAP